MDVAYTKTCVDTECRLEDLPGAMDDSDRWLEGEREKESENSMQLAPLAAADFLCV